LRARIGTSDSGDVGLSLFDTSGVERVAVEVMKHEGGGNDDQFFGHVALRNRHGNESAAFEHQDGHVHGDRQGIRLGAGEEPNVLLASGGGTPALELNGVFGSILLDQSRGLSWPWVTGTNPAHLRAEPCSSNSAPR